jgi:PAS domain S-box-containing protein/putative nucleotidyltransferase with HDIG domain
MTDQAINALLIEDNPLDVRLIREHLSEVTRARVALECADSLSAGLERLRKAPPDVLLLDLGLPESQGLDTLSRVLAEAPRTPVVVITGLDDEETAYQAVGEGAQDYLVKGRVDGELLVRSMRYAIERQRAEETLRESEERYRELVDNANDIVYTHDLEGNFTSANPAATRVYGYTAEEILHLNIAEIVDPEYLPLAQPEIREELSNSEQATPYELLTHTKDSKPVWVEVNTRLLRRGGRPVGVHGIARDITDRKRAEQALHGLMDFNEGIIQNMAEAIVVSDSQGDITFANPTCAALLGYTVEELVALPRTKMVPPDQRDIVEAADERRARGETDRYELELLRQDGERVPVLVSGGPRFQAGEYAGTLSVFTDISELKRAMERSRRRSEELAALNAVAASVTSTLNLEQVVEIIEDRVRALLGEKYPPVLGLLDEADEAFNLVLTSAGARLLARAGEVTGIRLELEELNFPLASVKPDPRAALLAGKPYVTNDASAIVALGISRNVMQVAQKALGIKCIVGLPLRAKGRLVGGLVLFSQREEISDAQIELLASIGRHAAIAIDNATLYRAAGHEIAQRQQAEEQLRLSHDRLREALDQTVMALSAAGETRDPYTAGHQRGVAKLAVEIAQEMGVPEEQTSGLRIAGLIHDIGKIQIPAEILSKPTRLTDPEWSMIKAHPQAGYDILKTVEFPWPVGQIVLQHHERLDGSGYPDGLSGEDILLEARILAVADVVEAMASHRPYRPAHALEETMEEIRSNRGTLYDPEVVDACLKLFTEKGFKLGETSIRGVA